MNAPTIDRLLRCFDREYLNPSAPTANIKKVMKPLFAALAPLAPLEENNEAKAIWLKVPKGNISDYYSFDDLKEYGEVETYDEYLNLWEQDYPDEYKWYELVVVDSYNKDGSLRYRGIVLNNTFIVSAIMDEEDAEYNYREDIVVELCDLLVDAVKEAIGKLYSGVYNREVNTGLPYEFKTGVIRRSVLWEKDPKQKEYDLEDIDPHTLSTFKNLLTAGLNNEIAIGRLVSMTANDFFKACTIGYNACGYDGTELSPVDQYFAHADGRDEGLSGKGYGLNAGQGINFDDPAAWDEWYFHRKQSGGHPWEVCRGGNSTHVSLYVCHDKNTLNWKVQLGEITKEEAAAHPYGYYFEVAGKHRAKEAVSFYVAISEAGLPVLLRDSDEILARFEASDYVGIVPHSVIPKYCESMFPNIYGNVIDFMHVYDDEIKLYGDQIEWLKLEEARLQS
ncbi:MAG: hypothetical protein IKE43_08990 [Coriobacteriales bacterium]|nr:hypothetical protein [Coriobacteriales bacterium]